jgi:predicted DNA-binding protein with PD1-like motif
MKYTSAKIKRVFIIKFDNNDDLLEEIYKVCRKEKIKSGIIFLIGALRNCKIVTGPKKSVIPPIPNFNFVKDSNEIIGIGTLFSLKNEPKIHLHLSFGRGKKTLTGCLRTKSNVFLVAEGVLFELDTKVVREYDRKSQLNLIKI